jgi:hypothetical protein
MSTASRRMPWKSNLSETDQRLLSVTPFALGQDSSLFNTALYADYLL